MNSGKFTPTVREATRPRLGFTRFTGDPVKIDSPIPGVGFNAFDDEVLAPVFHLKCSATMERTVVLTRHRIYLNYAWASWLALAQRVGRVSGCEPQISRRGLVLRIFRRSSYRSAYFDTMSELCPTRHEQHAIEAKLNMLLGASVYDRLFIGFEVSSVRRGILNVHVNLDSAHLIQQKYSLHVAIVVESVLRRAVKSIILHPK